MTSKMKASQKKTQRITLAQRIIILMAFFSILTIVSFAAIQVNNQLRTITAYNQYRSSLAAAIIKQRLETGLQEAYTPEEIQQAVRATLFTLQEQGIIDEVWMIDREKKHVFSSADNPDSLPGTDMFQLTLVEKHMVDSILDKGTLSRWFYTYIDKERGKIDIYIPLLVEDTLSFITKATFSLGNIREALKQVYIPLIMMVIVVVILNMILGFFLSISIVTPLRLLNQATKDIAQGKLDLRVSIQTRDEIQELGETFNDMTVALIEMKERAENANPLTKLPGNNVIREEVETRIREGRKFVVIHADIDNFKAYNDKYGLAGGDRAIQLTADLFKEAIQKAGNPDDFLGHEGGDDFVLVTTPDKAQELSDYLIRRLDEEAKNLYNEEDRGRGYIIEKNRQGVICKFPLMSISLAGVTNQHRDLKGYAQITNIMTEVKEKAKSIQGSVFFLDKRKE